LGWAHHSSEPVWNFGCRLAEKPVYTVRHND
jgi:hypothetical protein